MALKQLPDDFKEFIKFLNKNEVRYLLVGGWAIGVYGHPRATKDIDFLVAMDDENLNKLQQALSEFGAPPFEDNLFRQQGSVYRLGRSPIQIDVLNSADGIDIDECYDRRQTVVVEGVTVSIISREDLIKNKQASGRLQDLSDVEKLL